MYLDSAHETVCLFDKSSISGKISGEETKARNHNRQINIYKFRGTGSTAEEFIETEPIIYSGHVGISFDGGKSIYGFIPFTPGFSNAEVIALLKQHKSFPGQVVEDAAAFRLARDLAHQGYRTYVQAQPISIPSAEFEKIKDQILDEVESGPLQDKPYAFPGPQGCYNCATWLASHGIPIPEFSGNLRIFIS